MKLLKQLGQTKENLLNPRKTNGKPGPPKTNPGRTLLMKDIDYNGDTSFMDLRPKLTTRMS